MPLRANLFFAILFSFSWANASAHTRLEWSRPANGAIVAAPLEEIRLRFSNAAVPEYTRIVVLGPDGEELLSERPNTAEGQGSREFYLPLMHYLAPGRHTVIWRTVAADGHPVEGHFTFILAPEGERVPGELPETPVHEREQIDAEGPAGIADPRSALAVFIRLLQYAGFFGMTGTATFYVGVIRRMYGQPRLRHVPRQVGLRNWQIAVTSAVLSIIAMLGRLWKQSAWMHGAEDALNPEMLWHLLRVTTWGEAWILQLLFSFIFLAGLITVRPLARSALGWPVACVAACGIAFTLAMAGHSAIVANGRSVALFSHTLHILGAGVWLGGLAMLLLVGLPFSIASVSDNRMQAAAATVNLFSPVALTGVLIALSTGLINSFFHFQRISDLWNTAYGTTLLIKLAMLSVALAAGFYNWRYVRPRLHSVASPRALQRSAGVEITFGLMVLLATAFLVATQTPI